MEVTHSVVSYKKLTVPMSDMNGNIKENVITQILLRITATEDGTSVNLDHVINLDTTDFSDFIEEADITPEFLIAQAGLRITDMHQVHTVLMINVSSRLHYSKTNETEAIVEL